MTNMIYWRTGAICSYQIELKVVVLCVQWHVMSILHISILDNPGKVTCLI